MKNYLITGATGFIGTKLVENLLANQNQITILSRNKNRAEKIFGKKVKIISEISEVSENENIDFIINLAGEPIAQKRWSKNQKEILIKSRVETTQKIIHLIAKLKTKPQLLISASAIGFYGKNGEEELVENSPAKNEFTNQLCKEWEKAALEAEKFGTRICIIRLGIVLGKNGGALAKMLPAFKFGLGGKIASGQQFMSWVHIEDVIGAINFLTKNQNLSGVFNLTAPQPQRNCDFTKILAKKLKRPAFLNMPSLAIKILFGEMGETLLSNGQKVLPKNLIQNGFEFKYQNLNQALEEVLSTKI